MAESKKKVRMKDIAEKLSISINAVSLALNNKSGVSDETRQRVLKAAKELEYNEGYQFFIKSNQFDNICIMTEEINFRDVKFYSDVILGIENEAKKNKYDLIINFIDRNNYIVPPSIEQRKVSGIIIVGYVSDDYLNKVLSYDIPVILVDHASMLINTDAVLTQNVQGSFMETKYLIDKGHRDIGFFGDIESSLSFNERWIGYNSAMKKYNIPVKSEFCFTEFIEQYAVKNDYKGVREMLDKREKFPTAWVCANDSAAVTLVNALELIGIKVPDDISVIGFDDIELCKIITPNLSTIHVNKDLMGAAAVKNLIKRIHDKNMPCYHTRLEVDLIERKSVKAF